MVPWSLLALIIHAVGAAALAALVGIASRRRPARGMGPWAAGLGAYALYAMLTLLGAWSDPAAQWWVIIGRLALLACGVLMAWGALAFPRRVPAPPAAAHDTTTPHPPAPEVPSVAAEALPAPAAPLPTAPSSAPPVPPARSAAEQALQESEARFRSVFEHAGLGITILDTEGRIAEANAAMLRMVGRAETTLRGAALRDVLHPADVEMTDRHIGDLLAGRSDSFQVMGRLVRSDGKIVWARLTGSMVKSESGALRFGVCIAENLTRRRRAEAARRTVEDRFRSLIQKSGSAILCLTPDRRVIEINQEAERLLGWRRERVIGRDVLDLSQHELGSVSVLAEIRAAIEGQETEREFESVIESPEGQQRTYLWNVSRLTGSQGRPLGLIAVGQEITRLKEAERALRAGEERFRFLYNHTPVMLHSIDRAGRLISVSDYWLDVFGYTREEVLGRPSTDLLTEESQRYAKEVVLPEYFRTGICRDVPYSFVAKSGKVLDVLLSATAERNEKGEVVRSLAVMIDVTERKKAEQALRESEARYRVLFNSLSDAVIVHLVEPDGRAGAIIEVNNAVCRWLGYSREEILAMPPRDLIAEQDAAAHTQALLRLLREKHVIFEVPVKTRDGRRIATEFSAHLFDLGGRPCVLSVGRDITERKRLEQQLIRSQRMEGIGRLAGGVAHDFNNLLTAIMGYCELLMGQLPAGSPLRNEVQEIEKAGARAVSLTRQLLAFGRRQVLLPKVLDLNSVVREMAPMLRRLIGEDIELVIRLHPSLGNVKADPSQIEQVIMNLVVNARDAMPHGGRILIATAMVTVDAAEDLADARGEVAAGRFVTLSVTDTGCGMDESVKAMVFDPFFTTKTPDKGTGLGLSTVYGIVKQSGGAITVESAPGQGATFTVYLPHVTEVVAAAEPASAATPVPASGETVLVVEDELVVRDLVCTILRANGFRVLDARDGVSALQLAEGHRKPIDLMISDVVMPHMNGVELARRLAPLHPETRVLFMSGYADHVMDGDVMAKGDKGFIQKPFRSQDLLRRVREMLRRGRSGDKGAATS